MTNLTTEESKTKLEEFVDAIESLECTKADIQGQISDTYKDAKNEGFCVKALKKVIRDRKRERDEVEDENNAYDVYALHLNLLS